MNGPLEQPAVSGDTHAWGGAASSEPRIMRRLLDGADPVCMDCREPITHGAAKVGARQSPGSRKVGWVCGDCMFRRVYGR